MQFANSHVHRKMEDSKGKVRSSMDSELPRRLETTCTGSVHEVLDR